METIPITVNGAKVLEDELLKLKDEFRPRIVKLGAAVAIFRLFKDLQDLEGRHAESEVPMWRSCEFWSDTIKFVSQNHPNLSQHHPLD